MPTPLPHTRIVKPDEFQDPHFTEIDGALQILDDLSEWRIPEGASEADIAAALVGAHTAGAGIVKLIGLAYSAVGAPAFEITKPGVQFDLGAATITYTGSGDCILVQPTPFTVEQGAQVSGGRIDGSGAGDGACGIHVVDATGVRLPDVIVDSFDGIDSTGLCLETTGAHNQTERTYATGAHINNCTVDLRIKGAATGLPSFARTRLDLVLNSLAGQTTVRIEGDAYLYDSELKLRGNVAAGCILVHGVSGGAQHNRVDLGFETTGACTRFKLEDAFGGFQSIGQISCVGGFSDDIPTNPERLDLGTRDALTQQSTAPEALANFQSTGLPVSLYAGALIDNLDDPHVVHGMLIGAGIRGAMLLMLDAAGNAVTIGKVGAGDPPHDLVPVLYVTVNGQIVAAPVGAPPAVSFYAGAGGSPPAAVVEATSDNLSGNFTAGSGTSPAAGAYCHVVLYGGFPGTKKPRIVLTPTSAAAAALQAFVPPSAVTQSSFDVYLTVSPTASQANTVYGWTYHILG